MKIPCLSLLMMVTTSSFSQWTEFNQAHPISCQWPPFNYLAHGFFENVFVVDTIPNFYDGYLVFGRGALCNPDSCNEDSRNFSAKSNRDGNMMWWNRYDNPEVDLREAWFNNHIASMGGMTTNHKREVVSTFSTRQEYGEFDTFLDYLVYMNINGEIVEQHLIDSSFANYSFQGLIEDPSDSTYVLRGWYMDSLDVINNTEPDAFLLKIDSLGNHIWQKEYPNTFSTWSIVKAMDGGYWYCVEQPTYQDCSDGFFQDGDLVLIKTDEFGNEEDRLVMGGQCSNERATVYEYEQDKIILVGRLTSFDEGPSIGTFDGHLYTTFVEQFSNNQLSDTTEFKKYLHSYRGNFIDLHVLSNGSFLLVNDMVFDYFNSSPELQGRTMGSILKLDNNRDSLWSRSYSHYNNAPLDPSLYPYAEHFLLDSKLTPDGGIVCSGWIEQQPQDPNPFLQTPWLFKVDSLGCLEPGCQDVGVSEIVIGLQNTMRLFPNPVSSMANIAFSFPADYTPPKNSELVVIDMQGREVFRQIVTMFGQTSTSAEMDVTTLSAGIYTVHWVSGKAWLDSVKLVKE